jgi:hypothetical protein
VTGASRNRRVTHMMNIDWSNRAPPGPARPIRPAHRSIRAARQTCPVPARARRDGARRVAHWAAGQAAGCGGTEKPATRIRVGLQGPYPAGLQGPYPAGIRFPSAGKSDPSRLTLTWNLTENRDVREYLVDVFWS